MFFMLCVLQQHETSRGFVEVFYWLFKRIPYRRYYQWLGSYRRLRTYSIGTLSLSNLYPFVWMVELCRSFVAVCSSELIYLYYANLFWTSFSQNCYVLQTFFGQVQVRIAMFYRPSWTSSSKNCYVLQTFFWTSYSENCYVLQTFVNKF